MSFNINARVRLRQELSSRSMICAVGLCVLLSITPPVQAQDIDYDVAIHVIDAVPERSEALTALLEGELQLIKLRDAERMDIDQLRRMVGDAEREIAMLLATEGYYRPEISSSLTQTGERWMPAFRIVLNEPAVVGEVRLAITGAILDAPANLGYTPASLRAEWDLPAGRVFRHADWEAAKRRLLQQLVLRAYPLASLRDTRAEVDPASNRVALIVDLDSGPTVRFGAVRIEGLSRYPERIVIAANPARAGDLYSQDRLLEYQRRLQDTEFFQRVDVSATPMDGPGQVAEVQVPIDVTVDEYPRQRVSFGVGYSTNTGNRLQANYGRLNMFDRGVRFDGSLLLETKQQLAQTDFIFAPTSEGYRHTLSARLRREDISGELVRGASLYGRRAWGPENTERNVAVGLIGEQRDIAGLQTADIRAAVTSYGVIFRRTDNRLVPTRGYQLEGQVGIGLRLNGGNEPFVRAYSRAAWYRPLSERNFLILRAEVGAVGARSRAGIPTEWLFRTGGDQSVRGYAYQSLGVPVAGAAVASGRYMAVGSAEVVHWFGDVPRNWGAAAFVDAGNAADRIGDLAPVFGYGVGARWRSPVGQLNLDLAYGHEVRKARLHFSLGVNF